MGKDCVVLYRHTEPSRWQHRSSRGSEGENAAPVTGEDTMPSCLLSSLELDSCAWARGEKYSGGLGLVPKRLHLYATPSPVPRAIVVTSSPADAAAVMTTGSEPSPLTPSTSFSTSQAPDFTSL